MLRVHTVAFENLDEVHLERLGGVLTTIFATVDGRSE